MSKDTKGRVELITTNKNNNYATVEIEQENQAWLMGWSAKLGKVQGGRDQLWRVYTHTWKILREDLI